MTLPSAKGSFGPLRQLLAHLDDDDFILIVAWCLAALWPKGPYPILTLGGEQGSGKTSLARLVQRIVDPVVGDLLQPPGDDRDLIAAAKNGRVLAFDNVSALKADLADSICRLATGAEIGGRALYTNHDTATFAACRPVILNGIPDLVSRGDLADRSIVIKLGQITPRVTERDFWQRVDEVLPQTLAALLDAMALAITRLEETATPDVRMADFAQLIVAAEPALPWHPGEFLRAYELNRGKTVTVLIEGDLVATRLVAFAKRHNYSWSGLVSELYSELSQELSAESKRAGEWPGNPRWFSDRMTRAAPALRAIGIDIRSKQEAKGTRVDIREIAPVAPLEPRDRASSGASGATGAGSQVSDNQPSDQSQEIAVHRQAGAHGYERGRSSQAARAAGIRVGIDGESLTLEAPVAPPTAVLDLLSRHKADIVALLRSTKGGWSAEDWHAFYAERIGIAGADGGLSRAEAEGQAFGCCVTEWLNRNPVQSLPGRCALCGRTGSPDAAVLPFGTAMRGHAWLHAECWPVWYRGRQRQG